jgi:hypothetical protein
MNNQTLALIHYDISVAVRSLQKLLLTKRVIAELDKQNRIRHMQRLNRINYDINQVKNLCDEFGGEHGNYNKIIVEMVKNEALNGVIR